MNGIHPDLDIMILERLEPNSLQDAARVQTSWRHHIEHSAYKMRSISVDVIHLTLFSIHKLRAQLVTVRRKERFDLWWPPSFTEGYRTKEQYDNEKPFFICEAWQKSIPHITKIMKYSVKELRITFKRRFPMDENGLEKLNSHLPKWWIERIRRLRIHLYDKNEPIAFPAIVSRFAHLDDFILEFASTPSERTMMEGMKTQALRYTICFSSKSEVHLDGAFLRQLTQHSKLHPIIPPVLSYRVRLTVSINEIVTFITDTNFCEGHIHEMSRIYIDGNTEDWYIWKEKNTKRLNSKEVLLYFGESDGEYFRLFSFKFRHRIFIVRLNPSPIGGIGRSVMEIVKNNKYFT